MDVRRSHAVSSKNKNNKISSINKCIGDDTKGAARRSPNCIGKTKIRSVERVYPSHYQNSVRNCFHNISLKSGNRLLNYGQKRF